VRIFRYLRSLWTFRAVMSRHNVRALWRQSKPGWQAELGCVDDVTEEEFEEFLKAIDGL
jgi:hypothetical protein